ncbi:DUF1460 domain-containing protein [Myxococcota bacterium]|nr:DUF1460 domain-containing protein [Myxococcota bacterium]MBU1509298.1 DUF1460 domain-containing protein [Myxococcota bacterium]
MIMWLLTVLEFLAPWNRACPRQEQSLIPFEPAVLSRELKKNASRTLGEKVRFWSGLFLDAPYGVDPMGEEAPPDIDPNIEICTFDCETYVELVLALAFSESRADVALWLDRMRYIDGKRAVQNRYYTMALHWIPGNEKLGYLKHETIHPYAVISRPVFPKGRWWQVHRERFSMLGDNAPSGNAQIRYNSLQVLIDKEKSIPTPSLAFLVGARQTGNPFLITHMGFILKNEAGKTIFRHASRTPGRQRVEERELPEYLRNLRRFFNNPANPRRYVLGMSIYRLMDPGKPGEEAR